MSNQGLFVEEHRVLPEWIDINGHMNVAYYVLAFDICVDALWERIGITDEYVEKRQLSTFAVESHVTYQAELKLDDPFRIVTQLLAVDEKRLHQYQCMYHAEQGYLAATAEWLNVHVNLRTRRVTPFPPEILQAFVDVASEQERIEIAPEVGRRMRVEKPLFSLPGYADD